MTRRRMRDCTPAMPPSPLSPGRRYGGVSVLRPNPNQGTHLPACVAAREGFQRISERDAARILSPFVQEAVAAFTRLGAGKVEGVEVKVSPDAGTDGRHFGACSEEGDLILLSPEMAHLPPATIRGIIFHEYGHAADFLYPAAWVNTREGLRLLDQGQSPYAWIQQQRRPDGSMPPAQFRLREGAQRPLPAHMQPVQPNMLEDWRRRSSYVVETDADRLAEAALGMRIGYAGPCLLQTVGEGVRPRPAGLR